MKCWIEGAWIDCVQTTALHARACQRVRGIETLCAMDVSGTVNATPLWGRKAQARLEVKLSAGDPLDDQHGAVAGGTTQQVGCFGAIDAWSCAEPLAAAVEGG